MFLVHRTLLLACIALGVTGVLMEGYGQWIYTRDLVQQVEALPIQPTSAELNAILGPEVSQLSPSAAVRVVGRYTGVGLGALGALIFWGVSVAASDRDRRMFPVSIGLSSRGHDHARRLALLALGAGGILVFMVAAALGLRVIIGLLHPQTRLLLQQGTPAAWSVLDLPVALLMAFVVAVSAFLAGVLTKSTLGGLLVAGTGIAGEVLLLHLGQLDALAWTPLGWRWALIHAFLPMAGGTLTPPGQSSPSPMLALFLGLSAVLVLSALSWWLVGARREA